MDEATKESITSHGIPLALYESGLMNLGPANSTAMARLATMATNIKKFNLPIPPSPLIEMIADRTSGTDKLDFSMLLDGKKGRGKSISSGFALCRYAMEMAERFGQDPKDFFGLENCALLEDTEAITRLIQETDKHSAILIDDASTAVGSRDFQQEKNKNFNMILTVCRPKRWFTLFNTPVKTHIDVQIRELVDLTATVFRPFHAGGFNVLKVFFSDVNTTGDKKRIFTPRLSFGGKKVNYWVAFSPDVLDPFKGFVEAYDKARDDATGKLINRIAEQERLAKNPILKRDAQRQEIWDKYAETVKTMAKKGNSTKAIMRATGLSEYRINVMRGKLNLEEEI